MKIYKVQKWINGKVAADYGSFSNYEDVKALTKGYKLNEDMLMMFGQICYTRGTNSRTYYTIEIEEKWW